MKRSRAQTVLTIRWDSGPYGPTDDDEGMVVRMRSVSIGVMCRLLGLAPAGGQAPAASEALELFTGLADVIEGWNLKEDDGTPIPCTLEEIMATDFVVISEILQRWQERAMQVPGPLGGTSNGGKPPVSLGLT